MHASQQENHPRFSDSGQSPGVRGLILPPPCLSSLPIPQPHHSYGFRPLIGLDWAASSHLDSPMEEEARHAEALANRSRIERGIGTVYCTRCKGPRFTGRSPGFRVGCPGGRHSGVLPGTEWRPTSHRAIVGEVGSNAFLFQDDPARLDKKRRQTPADQQCGTRVRRRGVLDLSMTHVLSSVAPIFSPGTAMA